MTDAEIQKTICGDCSQTDSPIPAEPLLLYGTAPFDELKNKIAERSGASIKKIRYCRAFRESCDRSWPTVAS
jgi:hypothetical protein